MLQSEIDPWYIFIEMMNAWMNDSSVNWHITIILSGQVIQVISHHANPTPLRSQPMKYASDFYSIDSWWPLLEILFPIGRTWRWNKTTLNFFIKNCKVKTKCLEYSKREIFCRSAWYIVLEGLKVFVWYCQVTTH